MNIEESTIEKDITVMYVAARFFPEGILEAHQKLHASIPHSKKRIYFGLSRPDKNGDITYKAAAEELREGEAKKFKLKTITIEKGKYACITITDYMKNIQSIRQAFKKLIALPNIDPDGYCVEWYVSDKDIKCMVRLDI